jgi:hemerythrin-like domain-containing protein
MKRSHALAPLSRDHHVGLVAAQKLGRATAETLASAREDFLAFWRSDGQRHFRIEEEVLLPRLVRHGEARHEAVVRVLIEHVDIREAALRLEEDNAPPVEDLHALGALLNGHIRHEERTLFPLIEKALSEEELVDLAAVVERAETEG